jgi:hypothetical protein
MDDGRGRYYFEEIRVAHRDSYQKARIAKISPSPAEMVLDVACWYSSTETKGHSGRMLHSYSSNELSTYCPEKASRFLCLGNAC